MKQSIAILLIISLLMGGCAGPRTENLAESAPEQMICLPQRPDCVIPATDFALRLLQNTASQGENTLISPLSILAALGMTANGARGETLAQMSAVLGITPEELNAYLYSFLDSRSDVLKLANSLWLRDDGSLHVEENFLNIDAAWYHADVFKTTFDSEALSRLNSWVAEKTDGMIPSLLDEMPANAVMYLVNALAFQADWEDPYAPHQVQDGIFTTASGRKQPVQMMSSREGWYLEDEKATGFLKYYQDRRYAFAALLPREGITLEEYISALTANHLHSLLSQPSEAVVFAALPKFSLEDSRELSEVLQSLGMTYAFDPEDADFSGIGSSDQGNLHISRVRHKTAITVAEEGTRAAAATAVEMLVGSAYVPEPKVVTLDRPFLYLLIDCEENLPFFLGTAADMEHAALSRPAEASMPVCDAPPTLTVSSEDAAVTLQPNSYEWRIETGENITEITTVDAPYPPEQKDAAPQLQADTLALRWSAVSEEAEVELPPDSVEVRVWQMDPVPFVTMHLSDHTLIPEGEMAVYEIVATWEAYGQASYLINLSPR